MKAMKIPGRRPLLATAAIVALATAAWLGAPLAANAGEKVAAATPHAHAATEAAPVNIVRLPTDLPGPIGKRGPQRIKVDLETVEVTGELADGTSYHYWTFNKKVPGPFVRVRVGDTVEVKLKNHDDSMVMHNVDFHAVTGPGGGAKATEAAPGESRGFEFKALNPGLYVYHCATPMVAQHIANGMYGLILVEPEEGLPKVDHEFYVMQGEIYTEQAFGTKGLVEESYDKLISERPEYFIFNGSTEALKKNPLKAKVGETVRIYFGVGGPNYTSSFHVIGEIFDRAYPLASLSSPMKDVQTITTPPGGASVVDFKVEVPGNYILVDHALSRVERGLAGILQVEGPENPTIFKDHNPEKSAMSTSGH
ncbi:copper-containing nitrite reductase [Microvirga guangxiensis]|uniref:Copper-containing nitrite reductase n=1 Tax=Microvirga guangxiensis TaxID=549386 RepID=A0A1G5LLJ9_9HYPH|nr:copper-containing nitrite reductase [Microvirga guangxiensis]SCZ13797.1 nitrite reductase (NO-forming) [Microvirga guangxiensis]